MVCRGAESGAVARRFTGVTAAAALIRVARDRDSAPAAAENCPGETLSASVQLGSASSRNDDRSNGSPKLTETSRIRSRLR